MPLSVSASLVLAVAAGQVTAFAAHAPDGAARSGLVRAVAGPVAADLPTHLGSETFELADPDAFESDAARVEPGGPRGGYRVRGRVIVRAADAAAAHGAGAAVGAELRPADAHGRLPGFWYADAPGVRTAAEWAGALRLQPGVSEAYLDVERPRAPRATPTDPALPLQWHLINTPPGVDLNVLPAWQAGITGAGVTVAVVEGGWNVEHPDLAPNYNALASQEFRGADDHATAVAGIVAAADNAVGGVGVAFDASMSRVYYGFPSDIAAAFLFRNDLNAIKNNSWGPLDTGRVAAITSLELAALESAATTGRDGLGTVVVFAAGNGAAIGDRVTYDPYASSRFTLCVGAIDTTGSHSSYSEPGAALDFVTPSDASILTTTDRGIFTTTGLADYRANFGGTSATAPMASGVAALVLQANPALTRRDVRYVLIDTARRVNPDDPSWILNGAGVWHSDLFGFGLLDAAAAVALADGWSPVGPEVAYPPAVAVVDQPIPDGDPVGVSSDLAVGASLRIEHVEVVLTAPHARIGNLEVVLTSPSGTRSLLAATRPDSTAGYSGYVFTSVRHWNEPARGSWRLTIADRAPDTLTGTFTGWELRLYGTIPPCPADWDRSGAVQIADIFAFLRSFFAGAADFDNSGATATSDLFSFLRAWFDAGDC